MLKPTEAPIPASVETKSDTQKAIMEEMKSPREDFQYR